MTKSHRWQQAPALVVSLVALFAALSGAAMALPGTETVNSGDIKNESVKSVDLKDGKAVAGSDVIDETLTGADVDESTLGQVPDAATLNGRAPAAFVSSSVYKKESAVEAGTTLGDGTEAISVACDPGDILLSGGPANIRSTTTLLESFPTPGSTNSWTARVNKNGQSDNFSVVLLCANQ